MAGHKLIQCDLIRGGISDEKPGDFVEYLDDDETSGVVVFRRAGGEERARMNAADYHKMAEASLTQPVYQFTVKL
jgi:hypothetical protein